MKKTLSILMALCMILSVCFFSVSAAEAKVGSVAADYTPEGTAITDAAGFLAMAADGKYYLANDITIDATWNAGAAADATPKNNTAFTGTFDGNGKTVTVSVPLFANLQGTVKNLTVVGSINGNGAVVGAVAQWSNGTLAVENVLNKATIAGGSTPAVSSDTVLPARPQPSKTARTMLTLMQQVRLAVSSATFRTTSALSKTA